MGRFRRAMMKRPNPEIALGFLLASLFRIAVLGWQSSYSLTDGEKQQCYDDAKKSEHKSEECKWFWERTASDPVAFFTFTLTVVTLALGAISIRQFHYLKRSDATARIAAEAARNSANALISAERAHLFVAVDANSIGEIVSTYGRWDKSESMFSQDVETPSVAYSFRNFGKTHAIIKELSNQIIAAAEFPKVAEFTIREVMPDELVIAPGGQSAIMTCLMQDTFNVGGAVNFQKRKVAFWFYGYVVFDDTFGSEHRFEFRFCYRRGYGGPRLEYYREFTTVKNA
jgi:hypothetical protein